MLSKSFLQRLTFLSIKANNRNLIRLKRDDWELSVMLWMNELWLCNEKKKNTDGQRKPCVILKCRKKIPNRKLFLSFSTCYFWKKCVSRYYPEVWLKDMLKFYCQKILLFYLKGPWKKCIKPIPLIDTWPPWFAKLHLWVEFKVKNSLTW